MIIKVAQIIGLNTDQKAAQVISNNRGEVYILAVLDLTSDDAFTKGRQILSEIADFYFDHESDSAAEKVKATFEEVQKKLPSEEFSMLLGAVSGKILYLTFKGDVEVYLKRLEKVSPLLSVGAPNQLISGFLQQGDRLLFATRSLITFLDEDLEKALNLPLLAFEEEVTDRIGASNLENQGLAALLVDLEQEQMKVPNLDQEEPVLEDQSINIASETASTSESSYTSYQVESKPNPLSIIKKLLKTSLGFLWQQKKYFPKSGRGRLIIAAVLLIFIASGVGFKVNQVKEAKKQADFMTVFQESKDDFNAAKGLATLNPIEAKSKLDKSKEKVNAALNLKPKDNDAQNLKNQIEQESSLILQQSEVSDFPQFYDMELVKKNFRASQMSVSNGKILLLDPSLKTLVAIDIAKKSNDILAGSEQLGDGVLSSLNGAFGFVYSKDKGVLRVDTTNQKIATVSKEDSDWGEIKDIYSFAGNIYLLDSAKNQIWKYLPAAESYSDKREYLNKDTKADFTNTLRMQIESSVYILKSGGEILRFTRGDKDNFSLSGLPTPLKDPKSLFVSSDTDNLYLLDSGNSRLLILTKTGTYKGQITGSKFGQATDLVVDEKGKKVYLLDGGKIYIADLK